MSDDEFRLDLQLQIEKYAEDTGVSNRDRAIAECTRKKLAGEQSCSHQEMNMLIKLAGAL